MNFEKILDSILDDTYYTFFASAIGIISGLIAIKTYRSKKDKKETTPNINIRDNAKGICADCNSIISINSATCNNCNSTKPFEQNILTKKAIKSLEFNFDVLESFVDFNKNNNKSVKYYVYFFVPAFIAIVILAYIVENTNIYLIKTIISFIMLGITLIIYVFPHTINEEYAYSFNRSMSSRNELYKLNEQSTYIINSLHNKKYLSEIKNLINTILNKIEQFNKLNFFKNIFMWIYSFLIILLYFLTSYMLDISTKYFINNINMRNFFTLLFISTLFYVLARSIFIFVNIHAYFSRVRYSGKLELKNILYKIEKKFSQLPN